MRYKEQEASSTEVFGLDIGTETIEEVNYLDLPERRLLNAILERAVLDLKHKNKHVRKEAEKWFLASDYGSREEFLSYESICSLLDLNAGKIREALFS